MIFQISVPTMLSILCTVIVILLSYIICLNFQRIKEYIRFRILLSKLPTIPDWKFLIGHAHKVVGVSNEDVWKMLREDLKSSPVCTLYLGPGVVLVGILDADVIEAIISPMKHLPKADMYDFLRDWLDDGLLTSSGKKWQARRKILTPAFHFTILQQFIEVFTRGTSHMVKEIEEKYLNEPVDIIPIISHFTLLTINETSMGTKLNTKSSEGFSYKNAVYRMGNLLYDRMFSPWLHPKITFDYSFLGKYTKESIKIMHDFTNNIIQKKAENFQIFKDSVDEDAEFLTKKRKYPLLDILLNAKVKDNSIDDKGIREEVNTFMFEGHDTTAMSLVYTCMLLALHKEIQNEVYQEIIKILGADPNREPTYADLQEMTFLERCIKESLRLYPSVSLIGRKLDSDVPTKYGLIPKGATCFILLYDLHRNTKYWPDPEKFDPSRYLPENSRGRHPFAYIPFSAGPRNCIGQRFAMLEMKTAICGLIRKFILEPVDTPETLLLIQHMVLRPRDGLKVKFVSRSG